MKARSSFSPVRSLPNLPCIHDAIKAFQKLSNNLSTTFPDYGAHASGSIELFKIVELIILQPCLQGAVSRGQAPQACLRKGWNRMAANARSAAKSVIVLPFKIETPSFARLMVEAPEELFL
ncbi:MAG: hypothetical protein Q4A08_08125, partial [Bacteroidales bacterium]|nr:hypothetical protein [Bacteroidales bacterium]